MGDTCPYRPIKITKTRVGERDNALSQLTNEFLTYREIKRKAMRDFFASIEAKYRREWYMTPYRDDPEYISRMEVLEKIQTKMDIIDRMALICEWRTIHLFYPEYGEQHATYLKYINDIFDHKENIFTREHPLVASYMPELYIRDTCCVEIRSYTNSYLQPDEPREWQEYIWKRGVYINGKRLTSSQAHSVRKSSCLNLEYIMQHGVLTTTRGRGRFRDCKTVRFTAVRLTPKSIKK